MDMGCGTGVIGLSIKKQLSRMQVTMSDINLSAIENAANNAKNLNVAINIIHSDLFGKIPQQQFDVFICNPPYIDKELQSSLPDLACEPESALFADQHGLSFYELICAQIKPYLSTKFMLVFEIGSEQAKPVQAIILKHLNARSQV